MDRVPAPPGCMYAPNTNVNSLDGYSVQPRQKAPFKKTRDPIESHEYWISVHVTAEGIAETRSSASLKDIKEQLTENIKPQVLQRYKEQTLDLEDLPDAQQEPLNGNCRNDRALQGHSQAPTRESTSFTHGSISFPFQANPKRRRIDSQSTEKQPETLAVQKTEQSLTKYHDSRDTGIVPTVTPQARRILNIRVDETAKLESWFADAFQAIQQQICRFIAKEWIKLIHPKKQSTHPYNGNYPRHQHASPERTRPPYWPPAVQHKEPDHIDKKARTALLVHLIMQTPLAEITATNTEGKRPDSRDIYARDLLEVLAKKREELKDKWEIIDLIIRVRAHMEQFSDDGCDGDQTVSVPDYNDDDRPGAKNKRLRRKSRSGPTMTTQDISEEGCESSAGALTPLASPLCSEPTPADSDNDDGNLSMNVSFSSTITQASSRTPAQLSQLEVDATTGGQIQPSASVLDRQMTHLGPALPPNGIDYGHHGHADTRQATIHQQWPTASSAGPQMNGVFDQEMMLSQPSMNMIDATQFGDNMFRPAPMGTMLVLNEYHAPPQYGYADFVPDMNRSMSYRSIPDMSHGLGPEQAFLMHDGYSGAYAPHSHVLPR